MALTEELERRCETIADHLRSRKMATEEEIAACFDQPADDEMRAVLVYGDLRALHAQRVNGTGARQEVLAALSDEPAIVTLDNQKTLTVYPKSFRALLTIARIGERIDYLLRHSAQLLDAGVAMNDELFIRVDREVVFLYSALVFGATHAGPKVPFEDLRRLEKMPPWINDLTSIEVQRIHIAFVRVNAVRLAVIARLMKLEAAKEDGPGSTWATFFSLRSDETHIPSPSLMRDHSLASQMAAALIAATAKLRASKAAAA
jgi:hypothetical protein